MKKTIYLLLLILDIPIMAIAQISYGISVAGASSKMETGNAHENWGEYLSGGVFIHYTDKANFIYETGIYYDYQNLKLDRFSKEYTTDVDGVIYHLNNLKIPVTIGTVINKGIFNKLNLVVQGGAFLSYGLFGKGTVWFYNYVPSSMLSGVEVKNVYKSQTYSGEEHSLYYYPLNRFDAGTLFKIGIKYNRFSFYVNNERGLVNLNKQYDHFINSHKIYLSIEYRFAK
jgi:hypothetical protein